MKALYEDLGYKIQGYPGVTIHPVDSKRDIPPDTILSGRHGWIFTLKDPMRVGVVLCKLDGAEKLKYIDIKDLKTEILAIGYYSFIPDQLKYANNPNLRVGKGDK